MSAIDSEAKDAFQSALRRFVLRQREANSTGDKAKLCAAKDLFIEEWKEIERESRQRQEMGSLYDLLKEDLN